RGAGVLVRVRLFVSPGKPSAGQEGAAELVAVRAVCACSVVFAPKSAALPLPSPYTPHSVVFQCAARSISLSALVTEVAWPPVDSATASLPPETALPVSWTVASWLAVSVGTWTALLLV